MQRRRDGLRLSRGTSAVEVGHSGYIGGEPYLAGGAGVSNGSYSLGMGKTSPVRGAVNRVRFRLRQAASSGTRMVGALAFLSSCVLLLWCGVQVPALLLRDSAATRAPSTGGGGGVPQQHSHPPATRTGGARALAQSEEEEEEAGPRLAYGIMVYQRVGYSPQTTLDQLARMLNALYDKDNTYVLHVDIKSDKALLDAISHHIKGLSNVYQVPSVSVSWAGITVVERTLAMMSKALEVDSSWKFFVNIGHEDYPSRSQTEMRQWLKDKEDGTNFIRCWPIEGHDFFGQMEQHTQRVIDVNVDDFMGGVTEYRTVGGRPGSLARPKTEYKFFKSLQQTMLSRQLTEYAVQSSEARRLLLYMATSKAPDELYFPTLTQLDERFASKATCDDTRHFSYWIRPGGSWHPEYLTLDHLPLVLNASEFYIRKLEEARGSKPLMDTLDILRAGHELGDALSIMKAWLNRKGEDGVGFGAQGGPIMEFPEDGTVDEAMFELSRRQSEDAEAKRCMFLAGMNRRSQQRAENNAAAAAAAPAKNEQHSKQRLERKYPFISGPRAHATGGSGEVVAAAAVVSAPGDAPSLAGASPGGSGKGGADGGGRGVGGGAGELTASM